MSREIRRVPLDFDAPIDEIWAGYIRPNHLDGITCKPCGGRGATPAAQWLETLCARIAMLAVDVGDQRRDEPMHPWIANDQYPPTWHVEGFHLQIPRVSDDILPLMIGLTGRTEAEILDPMASTFSLGGRVYHALVKAANVGDFWGVCPTCDGEGHHEAYHGQRAEATAWERTDPPDGNGYQLWSTISDGKPISPVCATPDELAEWMVANDEASTMDVALRFIDAGWSPSFVGVGDAGPIIAGVEYVGASDSTKEQP